MEEKELIDNILAGDKEAFEPLVRAYEKRIFLHCKQIVHDEEIAQDLTQEAFLHAYEHLASFEKRSSFYSWLWRIAHNLSLNYLKKEERMPKTLLDETKLPLLPQESYEEFLALLPEKQREVFALYYFEQLSQKEIAQKLGIPYGTVRSRIHYAKQRLRKLKA